MQIVVLSGNNDNDNGAIQLIHLLFVKKWYINKLYITGYFTIRLKHYSHMLWCV